MPQRYIIFKNSEFERHITIVGKQPFYKIVRPRQPSANIWFPFIMCKGGIIPFPHRVKTTPEIHEGNLNHCIFADPKRLSANAIFPADNKLINPRFIDLDIAKVDKIIAENFCDLMDDDPKKMQGRLVTKTLLLIAMRLTPQLNTRYLQSKFIEAANFNEVELKWLQEPIWFDDEPEMTTSDPLKVNLWLLSQEARQIKYIYQNNKNMAELFSGHATFDFFRQMRWFVPTYTNNLFAICHDPLIKEAAKWFFELHDATARLAYRQIQDVETPIRNVLNTIDKVEQQIFGFVERSIPAPLTKKSTENLVNFCLLAKEKVDKEAEVADRRRKRPRIS